jgi:hypothetical protein
MLYIKRDSFKGGHFHVKKKLLLFISIFVVSLSLTGCGKPSKEECAKLMLQGKMQEFEDGECMRHIEDELSNLGLN